MNTDGSNGSETYLKLTVPVTLTGASDPNDHRITFESDRITRIRASATDSSVYFAAYTTPQTLVDMAAQWAAIPAGTASDFQPSQDGFDTLVDGQIFDYGDFAVPIVEVWVVGWAAVSANVYVTGIETSSYAA